MRELTEKGMEQVLEEYGGVIYAALKSMGMYRSHQNFDDYYQLGCLKLFDAYASCAKDPLLEENRYAFVNYALQRVKWAFLDEKRRERKLADHEESESEEETGGNEFVDDVALVVLVEKILLLLSPKEQNFLVDRFYYGLDMSAIAKKRGVSRKTVHAWRNNVQKKTKTMLQAKN